MDTPEDQVARDFAREELLETQGSVIYHQIESPGHSHQMAWQNTDASQTQSVFSKPSSLGGQTLQGIYSTSPLSSNSSCTGSVEAVSDDALTLDTEFITAQCATPATDSFPLPKRYQPGQTIRLQSSQSPYRSLALEIIKVLGHTICVVLQCRIKEPAKRTTRYMVGDDVVLKIFDSTAPRLLREHCHLLPIEQSEVSKLQLFRADLCRNGLDMWQICRDLARTCRVDCTGSPALAELGRYQEIRSECLPRWEILQIALGDQTILNQLSLAGFLTFPVFVLAEVVAWCYAISWYCKELRGFCYAAQYDEECYLTPQLLDVLTMVSPLVGDRQLEMTPFDRVPVIMMELVEGRSLVDYLFTTAEGLKQDRGERTAVAMSEAILAAWRRGFQHTDLHLDNALVANDPSEKDDEENIRVRFVDMASIKPVTSAFSHIYPEQRSAATVSSNIAHHMIIGKDPYFEVFAEPESPAAFDPLLEAYVLSDISESLKIDCFQSGEPRLSTGLFQFQTNEMDLFRYRLILEDICYNASTLTDRELQWVLRLVSTVLEEAKLCHEDPEWDRKGLLFCYKVFTAESSVGLLSRFDDALPGDGRLDDEKQP